MYVQCPHAGIHSKHEQDKQGCREKQHIEHRIGFQPAPEYPQNVVYKSERPSRQKRARKLPALLTYLRFHLTEQA